MSSDTNDSDRGLGRLNKQITDLPAVYLNILNTTPEEMIDLQRKLKEMPENKIDEVFESLIDEIHKKEEMNWLFTPHDHQVGSGLGVDKSRYYLSIKYNENEVNNVELVGQTRSPADETVIYPQWVERGLFQYDCLQMLSISNNVLRSAAVSSPRIPTPSLLHKHLIWQVSEMTAKHYHVSYDGDYPDILEEYTLILQYHNKTEKCNLSEQSEESEESENTYSSLIGSLLSWIR